jgi:hypothetical protein
VGAVGGQHRSLLEAQRDVVREIQRVRGAVIEWVFPRFDGSQLGGFRKAWDGLQGGWDSR